jgi:hypothetical protein
MKNPAPGAGFVFANRLLTDRSNSARQGSSLMEVIIETDTHGMDSLVGLDMASRARQRIGEIAIGLYVHIAVFKIHRPVWRDTPIDAAADSPPNVSSGRR